jgi:aryl-alcohol dehydrogenase-like predicted oxidoreductase
MQRRLFGPTGREVAAIGMGTWYFEQADRQTRSPPCGAASISA